MPTKPISHLTVAVHTKGRVRVGKMPGARLAFDATKQEKRKVARKKKGPKGKK
tara:strand:- start:1508 stop:1666 length:159 start_codon:yes stop_codon:yes gene_type:complete